MKKQVKRILMAVAICTVSAVALFGSGCGGMQEE